MSGRIDVEPDHISELLGELGIVGELELAVTMRLEAMSPPDPAYALALMPLSLAIMAAVQWVASPGGSVNVRWTTRSAMSGPSGLIREGRVLSRSSPSTPACMKLSCQRQTQVLEVPVWRMISAVPMPSALNSTMAARQTCF